MITQTTSMNAASLKMGYVETYFMSNLPYVSKYGIIHFRSHFWLHHWHVVFLHDSGFSGVHLFVHFASFTSTLTYLHPTVQLNTNSEAGPTKRGEAVCREGAANTL